MDVDRTKRQYSCCSQDQPHRLGEWSNAVRGGLHWFRDLLGTFASVKIPKVVARGESISPISIDLVFKYHWERRENPIHREYLRWLIRSERILREKRSKGS